MNVSILYRQTRRISICLIGIRQPYTDWPPESEHITKTTKKFAIAAMSLSTKKRFHYARTQKHWNL